MTSSLRSTVAAVGMRVTDCGSVPTCVLLMVFSFDCDFCRELIQALAKHPVERREGMDHIGENLQRRSQLDCKHELTDDFACARRDHGRADQDAALTVGDQLERASMEVVNVAARGF